MAKPSRRAAETNVLRIRQAMVIGPTPPGTGVIALATSDADAKVDVADEARFGAIDPDIDHASAGFQPIALDHLRPSHRGDHDVPPAHDFGQVLRPAVGDGHRAACADQQQRHRLANDIRPADHDRSLATEVAELG